MMIRLLVILIALCGIVRGQSTVVETELWTIKFDASVTAPQRASVTKAATHIGWVVDRKFPDFAPWCKNGAGTIEVFATPGLGWTISQVYYSGPAAQVGTRMFPMRVMLEINSDNWNNEGFGWGGDLSAYKIFWHELLHCLGLAVAGLPDISHDGFWWGPNASAAYGGPVPLADIWHLHNEGIFRNAILSNAIELEPQFLTPIEEGMLEDLGFPVKTKQAVNLDDLFPRRTDPYRNQQPVSIVSPTGEIIPHNP